MYVYKYIFAYVYIMHFCIIFKAGNCHTVHLEISLSLKLHISVRVSLKPESVDLSAQTKCLHWSGSWAEWTGWGYGVLREAGVVQSLRPTCQIQWHNTGWAVMYPPTSLFWHPWQVCRRRAAQCIRRYCLGWKCVLFGILRCADT